jgi:hypothetical protein
MLWYAAEPLATADAKRALGWAEKSSFTNHLPFMVRRLKALDTPDAKQALGELRTRLAQAHDNPHAHHLLTLIDESVNK